MKKNDENSKLLPISAVAKKRGARVLGDLLKCKDGHNAADESQVEVKMKNGSLVVGRLLNKRKVKLGSLVDIVASDSNSRRRGILVNYGLSRNVNPVPEADDIMLNPKTVALSEQLKRKKKMVELQPQPSVIRIRSVDKIQNILKAFEEQSKPAQMEKKVKSKVLSREAFLTMWRKNNGRV